MRVDVKGKTMVTLRFYAAKVILVGARFIPDLIKT
jgi:hypothetical protein